MENTQDLLIENQLLKKAAARNKLILLVLFVLTVCSVVFTYIQRTEAERQKAISENLMKDLQQARTMVEETKLVAMMQRDRAEESEMKCNQALLACQQKSK